MSDSQLAKYYGLVCVFSWPSYKLGFEQKRPIFEPGIVTSFDLVHNDSCRGILVSQDGSNRSIALSDIETGRPHAILPEAHESSLQACSYVSSQLFATGDDEGILKIWDERILGKGATAVMQFKDHIDFISSIQALPSKKTMVTGGGDGFLHVYDLRKNKCKASSDPLQEEILSMSFVKGGKNLVCGMQDGSVNIFSWDYWAGPSDRILGHPSSVDSMVALNSSAIATGGGDGFLRYVGIRPNSLLGWTAIPHHFDDIDNINGEYGTGAKGYHREKAKQEEENVGQQKDHHEQGLRFASSPVDIVSDDNFWPISTISALNNPIENSEIPLLVCGSQEMVYVTASHLKYFSKAKKRTRDFALSSDNEELDVGGISDYKPSEIAAKRADANKIPKGRKNVKTKKALKRGFLEAKQAENSVFFTDLLEYDRRPAHPDFGTHDDEKELDLENI